MSQQMELPAGSAETDIAIVGMAGRFPGARDIHEFWANLRAGTESVTWLTDEQLRAAGVSEEQLADPQYVRACYPMPDMDGFDAGFFGFAPREAGIMDPQQRHFLELAWTACEHAGHDPARFAGSIGVYAGCGASTYLMFNLLTNPELVANTGFFLLRHTGNDKDFLATRVSYLMNLRGPSVNVQTACSTSLVAVHAAVQSLLNHECDLALAGGSTIKQPHLTGYQYEEGEILSPDGHCRSFDEKAEGTTFGSGAGVVVLRRLADAIRDGDTIHAVIKGSAINNDGSTKVGYLAPSVDGQAAVVAEALSLAGVSPEDVQYVECHGTATPVGDPIEIAALTQAYRLAGAVESRYCAIGTVKSNIGHLDTAAGVAGLIKTVQAIRHGEIPASLHYTAPNPAVEFDTSPFFVNAALRPWTTDGRPRRAGVSALGAGGTNAHVVIEEAPVVPSSDASRDWQLYVLSAKTPTALDTQAANLAAFLDEADVPAADVAFTLANGRQPFTHRRAVVASSAREAAGLLRENDAKRVSSGTASERQRSVAFMFAGGGAQHPGMGEDLYNGEPVYREAVDECIALLQPRLDWDLAALLYPAVADREQRAAEMERPSRSLPCLFITQYAMARLCLARGLEPKAMIGHSMGEYTAAHLAGVFSLADALALVTLRGQLFETVAPGGMLSVSLSADELAGRLPPELSIAAVNAPELCVASGPVEALERLEAALEADEIDSRRVRINIAAHSSMLEPILAEFGAFFRGITLSPPQRPFVSNVTGTWITAAEATSPEYWVRHLRNTVRFADGVGILLEDEGRVLVEVGPGRTLATLASLHGARRREQPVLTSMRHPDEPVSDVAHALGMLARAWVAGVSFDTTSPWRDERRRRVPLPTYPFEHQPYYIAPGKPVAAAPTLAKRTDVGSWFHAPNWIRTPLQATEAPHAARWLVFHDEQGTGHRLVEALIARGGSPDAVVSVLPGDDYAALDARTFRVDPSNPEHVRQVLSALSASGGVPSRIVHTWNLDAPPASMAAVEGRAFYSLLGLLQGIAAEGIEEPVRLDVLTAGMQHTGAETVLEPRRALVLGPVRVAERELPNVTARSVDVPLEAGSSARLVDRLLAELDGDDAARVVALRGGTRLAQSFSAMPLPPASGTRAWARDGAVCLVTGGLGGLGLLVAGEMARAARVRLVLMGRSGLPDRATWPQASAADGPMAERIRGIQALETAGAEVLVVTADVSDAGQVTRAVAEARARFGGITHLVHAAGVVEDALIPLKEPASAARVFAPKVAGTLALEAALADEPVEGVVLFSSRGAVAGVAGQVDYTSASAFLDAWAERQSARGVPTLSIDWSAWQGVGLAAALTGGAISSGEGRPTTYPLLDRCVRADEAEAEYRSLLTPSGHWLLDGHRIRGGDALIPGTGYLDLVRAAVMERAAPDVDPRLELRDVFFIAPFMIPDGGTRELRITIDGRTESDVVIEGRAPGATAWEEHARALAAPLTGERPAPGDPTAIRARCSARHIAFSGTEAREHLILGARWSNIRTLDYGEGEALATLKLPADFVDELATYPLHPALLDVATACAQELIPGFDGTRDFYIPVSYGRVRLWAPLEGACVSHIRLQNAEEGSETAVYDVTVMAADGRVLVDIADFTMMKVRDRVRVGHEHDVAPAVPLQMRAAITPDEGLDAFRRLLAAGVSGQVVVSPQDLGAYLEALRTPEETVVGPSRPVVNEPPPVDVSEVEAVLATHEAVHTVVVTARHERAGTLRVTAFVVFELGEQATVSEIRRYLRGKVPDDLVPQHLVELDELPLGGDGKVDRAALPDPFAAQDDFVGPRTEMEYGIARIWMELLGVAKLSVYDNFLDVGGHSLLAMRAVSRIAKQTGVRLNPSVMTLHTLEQIAAECAEKAALSGRAG